MVEPRGRLLLQCKTLAEMLELDAGHGLAGLDAQDHLFAGLLERCLAGDQTALLEPADKPQTLHFSNVSVSDFALLEARCGLTQQQARGAWYHPKKIPLNVGLLNLPFYYRNHGRFPMNAVMDERVALTLDSAEAIAVWASLEPLLERLFKPLLFFGPEAAKLSADKHVQVRQNLMRELTELGIPQSLLSELVGEAWWKQTASEMHERKLAYLERLKTLSVFELVRASRLVQTQGLIKRFYAKRRTHSATRENVLTKQLERALSGVFAGDWHEFLAYIEEPPEAGDHIQTALPEPMLIPGVNADALKIAQDLGLSLEQVQEVGAALFPEATGSNPIADRVNVVREVWHAFLHIHARQVPGNPSLWGLVQQAERVEVAAAVTPERAARFGRAAQYKIYFSADLQDRVERLWATCVHERYPGRLVTNLAPWYWMGRALGPALAFWEGVLLTAWYVTEGPYSRTDLPNMEAYYDKQVLVLEKLRTPVDRALFRELRRAEPKLGEPKPVEQHRQEHTIEPGVTFTSSLILGERREGFAILRDIIIRHAQAWSETYLEDYLTRQWREPLRLLSEDVSKRLASKGKAHSPKQFAKLAAPLANMWFGGDLTAVSVAILQPAPVKQQTARVIPEDVLSYADMLYKLWLEVAARHDLKTNFEDFADRRSTLQTEELTRLSLDCLQLAELLGEAPTYEQFVQQRKTYDRDVIPRLLQDVTQDLAVAWKLFVEVSTPSLVPEPVATPVSASPVTPSEVREVLPPLHVPVEESRTEKPNGPFSWLNRIFGRNKPS